MTIWGIDNSYARPGGYAISAAGDKFDCRYYGGDGRKDLTAAEVADLVGHGVAVVGNYEGFATEMRGGAAAGRRAGLIAGAQARAAGQPAGRPIYYSDDSACPPSMYETIYEALVAAEAASGYPSGCYGSYGLLEYLYGRGIVWLWETAAASWNDYRGDDPHALLVQLPNQTFGNGADVDFATGADYGQWGIMPPSTAPVVVVVSAPPVVVVPKPVVTFPEGVYDMFIAQTIGGQGQYIITSDGHKIALDAADSPSVPQMLAILQASDPHPVPLSAATITAIPAR